ncbi:hypothetical protein ACP70R_047855 [Stipagrostis hirtigluma subsp. patula]
MDINLYLETLCHLQKNKQLRRQAQQLDQENKALLAELRRRQQQAMSASGASAAQQQGAPSGGGHAAAAAANLNAGAGKQPK